MSELVAVLVAAGRSRRMGDDKLWIDLWGRPVWRWSLDALLSVPQLTRVAIVAPPDRLDEFRARLPVARTDRCLLVDGGEERADSVRAGLEALSAAGVARDAVVLVHDAARPAASSELMAAVADAARDGGAAIPVIHVADTIKRVEEGIVVATIARDEVAGAQTPQAASLGILLAAIDAARASGLVPTDEAAALAALGVPVVAAPGERGNVKLTEAGDVDLLRAVLRQRSVAMLDAKPVGAGIAGGGARVGIGFDAHRLEAGIPLRLGGLDFPDEPRGLAGHSDGDVALHAVIDALLGAAGLGDVGSLFPSGEARWSGVDSRELVKRVIVGIREVGLRPVSTDLVVVAARPAIHPVADAMAARIAQLLDVGPNAVTVKGTTSDGLGFAGEEGIAAYAVAAVERIAAASS
jgi:2-C-methyl-D-erythritol 4-phosphate cytidylyltransferase / 2-C-methyl-D-erythritol 2,4-cyclodiphosphate synthase